ncbi:hypothetical protein M758_3G010700 [Ceratodon purpureus]|uniref:Protein kinase domain-containing protein n=1 Tax=Ceratodon purpureus TaxID=3225 RepID=A0A8T0IFN4_CERPU|nr:hypothetical protein KC19_3G010900 [Ceratodon purpureus]KAG0621323.1 hypothetical protein M758_3G010700 [Ceratodon purpureus]
MSDELLLQLSSNSNSSLDPGMSQKMAKLEARMAGKAAPMSPQKPWLSAHSELMSVKSNGVTTISSSGDSDSDDVGEFVIQPNPRVSVSSSQEELICRKRKRLPEANSKRSLQVKEVLAAQIAWQEEKAQIQEELTSLQEKNCSLEEDLVRVRKEAANAHSTIKRFEKDLKERAEKEQQREQKRIKVVSDLLVQLATVERQESRTKLQQECNKLGNVGVMRGRAILSEVWEDGQAFKDVQAKLRSLLEQKASLEKNRKELKKQTSDGSSLEPDMSEEDVLAMEEVYRFRLLGVKREEEAALKDRDRLEQEKKCLIRELKRCRDEDASPFNHFPILNKRYALLNLLGKGGFSEVYKAYDLVDYRYVACKLHRLNEQWSEEKKQTYVRHAIREYNIHKNLVHRHIVRLWDIFEIDHNTFCTVLEYCSGKDLDVILKETPVLPEREARSILVQIFSGLVKLNKQSQRIIHYDLKPANILFNSVGVAKITDFGLSKIVEEESGSQGMELTSQGAGTYWYLPPECFDLNKIPLISSKVDVWSVGVIYYQMLFGKRPFGHNQCQEQLVREDTIVNARKVEFPSRPSVSLEAKEFIRRCLTYDQVDRPDVLTAAQDPYLSYMKKKP